MTTEIKAPDLEMMWVGGKGHPDSEMRVTFPNIGSCGENSISISPTDMLFYADCAEWRVQLKKMDRVIFGANIFVTDPTLDPDYGDRVLYDDDFTARATLQQAHLFQQYVDDMLDNLTKFKQNLDTTIINMISKQVLLNKDIDDEED